MQNNFRTIKNKTKNFTIIDNAILQDKNLSLKARGLLCFMLHLPENWVFTEKGLATATGEGLKSIKSGLKELESNKYLYRMQMRNMGGAFSSMIYYLFEQPTEMKIEGKSVNKDIQASQIHTKDVFNIDKTHPDFHYLNGGWMLED
ncbi:helix-turn-helix domain-containing protein [Turicibacter sanguinis]|uniref:helix-turn-helix domain-containing protein n=1 Tax=Turicibacter sanguinis TaxID=154288 RepID=UPI00294220C5|nr:helix-turn-helix domain-containing protein [Turicibacter sanguinis]